VDFTLPEHLPGLLTEMDAFIEREIAPLQAENMQYFDYRREHARTDWDNDGIPTRDWEDLLGEMRRRADKAGWLRYGLPASLGGRDGTNVDMAVIREHLAHKGLGLHNDLQNESSIVGNFPQVIMMERFGTDEQRRLWSEALITGECSMAFGLTEPRHGSDATWLETHAEPDGDSWVINGSKRFNTGVHRATHDLIFARTSGEPGQARGITAFLVPTDTEGFNIPYYWWTFNMPTDHGEVELTDVRVPADAVLGAVDRGLEVAQTFLHENRIRQAASSLGAAQFGRRDHLHGLGDFLRRLGRGDTVAQVFERRHGLMTDDRRRTTEKNWPFRSVFDHPSSVVCRLLSVMRTSWRSSRRRP